ncbi:carbohydrate porin [Paludibaculum fermentans]|uniref:carbohydrate porin n=1 Tax=Paludibaculum fermentans TaxID=1473598 RepID=UPI003EC0C449
MNQIASNIAKAGVLTLLAVWPPASAAAQELIDTKLERGTNSPYMLGDWSGGRTRLANKGVTFNLIYVDDVLSDTRRDVANWSRVRGTLDIDFEKAEVVRGLKFHITAMWQAGGNLGAHLGTIANPSSLASVNLIRLDSWWFEKAFVQHKLFVRAGQFAGLDSYGVQPYGESFINEPLGYAMGNLIQATYETFAPAATPAFEVRYVPSRRFYVKSAIFSGNRNPFHDDENGVHFRFKDAPVIAAEAGYFVNPGLSPGEQDYSGLYAFGTTINTGPFQNIATGQRTRTNYLLYFTANQQVCCSQARTSRALDVAFTVDWTPEDMTRNFSQLTGGLRYRGLLRRREHDTASLGFVYSRSSGVLNRALSQYGMAPYAAEKLLELNYAFQLNRWLTFQPVFQYYFDTGGDPRRRNNAVAGFRTLFVL